LYVSATDSAVSGALVVEKEIKNKDKIAKQQFLEYFVSEVLAGSKKFYSEMEKICFAAVVSSRKLRHYFEAHTIKVLTNQPLNDIFDSRDSFGRINKWAMEISEYVVNFEKCGAIQSQVLANFVVEWMEPRCTTEGEVPETPWVVYCDGSWGQQGRSSSCTLLAFGD
jgi:hypothetical protein